MQNTPLITFQVSDVQKPKTPFETIDYNEAINLLLNVSEEDRHDRVFGSKLTNVPVYKIEATSNNTKLVKKRKAEQGNMFVTTLNTAYDKHLPIQLSPDMIWLIICQGIANHLRLNPSDGPKNLLEKDKTKITVRRDEFIKGSKNDWDGVIDEFSMTIKKLAGEELYNQIIQNFSTTGLVEKTAFGITLMDCASSYFDYGLTTMCGFPSIALEGTVEDWQSIYDNASQMKQYGLNWWWGQLQPVLQEFVNASKGQINPMFWLSLYKYEKQSGGPYINGYITSLFPYLNLKNNGTLFQNDFQVREGWSGLTISQFPDALSAVDFKWLYYMSEFNMKFLSGFVGYTQDKNSLTIRPEIGWVVAEVVQSKIVSEKTTEKVQAVVVPTKSYEEVKQDAINAAKASAGVFTNTEADIAIRLQNDFKTYSSDVKEKILKQYGSIYDWSISEASKQKHRVPSQVRPSFKRS